MRGLGTPEAARVRRVVAVVLAAVVSAAGLSDTLVAQEPNGGRSATGAPDTAAGRGPAFFTIRESDGEHVDARNSPALDRRISLTLIGIPLGMAVQAIADRAGLEATFSLETIPRGARVSMHADDVTVVAALRWVLANARVDVLLQNDTHLTLVPRASAAASDSSGVLAGDLVDGETGEPVPYGTVMLLGTDLARFTDGTGHFRMARLVAHRYVLRARQIGYSPVDSTVAVARDSTTQLTIRMHRVPAVLGLVRVNGHHTKGCVATGIPDSTVDPTLAAVFAQIRENVDRYNLLLKSYPFRYAHAERQVIETVRGDSVEYTDTLGYESQERRPYRVGGLLYRTSVIRKDSVFRDDSVPGGTIRVFVGTRTEVAARRRVMYLPTFADLADSTFLATHCFEYGGEIGGNGSARLIRVSFEPAKKIKTPDVSGSVDLDADSLVLRRAVFGLTKPEAAKPPLIGFAVTTTFREILPLVPIIDSFESVEPLGPTRTARGSNRLIGFAFEGPTPGEETAAASDRTTVASMPQRDSGVAAPATTLGIDPGVTRIRAIFPADSSCRPTAPVDTISVILYGTLQGQRPRWLPDTAWSTYISGVLSAFSQSFALPDTLSLRTFSWPFQHAVRTDSPVSTDRIHTARHASRLAIVNEQRQNVGPFVVPMISTGVTLTLGADGSLRDARLTGSSTSPTVDSLVLAAVRRAGAADAFPRLESSSDDRGAVRADLVVSIAEPAPGEQVVALGRLDAPSWPSVSAVRPVQRTSGASAPDDLRDLSARGPLRPDTTILDFVVNDRGEALPETARREYSGARSLSSDQREHSARRLAQALSEFRFDAGRIKECDVPEFVRYNVKWLRQ